MRKLLEGEKLELISTQSICGNHAFVGDVLTVYGSDDEYVKLKCVKPNNHGYGLWVEHGKMDEVFRIKEGENEK